MKTVEALKFWLRVKRGEYIAAKDLTVRESGSAAEHRAVIAFIGEVLGKIEELELKRGFDEYVGSSYKESLRVPG